MIIIHAYGCNQKKCKCPRDEGWIDWANGRMTTFTEFGAIEETYDWNRVEEEVEKEYHEEEEVEKEYHEEEEVEEEEE